MVLPIWRAAAAALVCIAANHAFPGMVHAQSEQFGAIGISKIRAVPPAGSASAKLLMTISNEGPEDVHLLYVSTPIAKGCSFVFETRPGSSRDLESIAIRADQTVRFDGGFLWIKLSGLYLELDEGDRIPVTLHFLGGNDITILVPVEDGAAVPGRGPVQIF